MTGEPVLDSVVAWSLSSVRVVALFASAPVFGHNAVPRRIRAGLAMVFALVFAPPVGLETDASALGLGSVVVAEILVGLSLGFAVRLLFAAFDLLGEFISVQGGLGAASVVDPSSGSSSLALASALQTFMLLAFLALDGHHDVLRAIALSYELLPIGSAPPGDAFLGVALLGARIFEIAVRLAAPVTVAMLVANVSVGILGRAIPQLNLMMLQLPAHVAMTLGLLLLGAGALVGAARVDLETWTERSLAIVAGGG